MRCPALKELLPAPLQKTGWPWTEESPRLPAGTPDGKPWPMISVVTPTYNQSQFIEKTIRSVFLQGYPNLEYIIIDGGSTDNTAKIINKYQKYLKYWVSEPDTGQSNAINKGFKHATGDLLAWLNSDDYYMPGAFHKVAQAAMVNSNQVGAYVGIGQVVDSAGKTIYSKKPPSNITVESLYNWMNGGDFMQASCVFTRSAWEECCPLDEDIHLAFDLDLWLRMVKKDFTFVVINDTISTAVGHKDAKTQAFKSLMRADIALVVMRHGGEHVAKKYLEEMARRLLWYELNFWKIMNNPAVKLFGPLIRAIIKPAIRWRDTIPKWIDHD